GESSDLGVDDRVEPLASGLVTEHDARERGPVETAVVVEHSLPELGDDAVETDAAGSHRLAREEVVVDDDGAALGEPSQHDRLARGDPAGQSDALHADHPAPGRPSPPRLVRVARV